MRQAFILGAAVGAALGAVVLTGYAAAGWWVCSSLTDCPAHWLPYAIVFVVGVAFLSLAGGGIAAGLRGMYRMTRVDTDDDRATPTARDWQTSAQAEDGESLEAENTAAGQPPEPYADGAEEAKTAEDARD